MSIHSPADLIGIRRAGRVVALVLEEMRAAIRAGLTTRELDAIGAAVLARHGARSAPREHYRFPGYTCISVNEEVVHGVPGERRLQPGDVVKIDVTAELHGYIADAARTVIVGQGSAAARRLRQSAIDALDAALAAARPGARVSAIGRAVHDRVRRDGFSILRELCGHGVGRQIHESPSVPNYEDPLSSDVLTEGLVLAIEPMIAARPSSAVQMSDGWTIRSSTRCLTAHEEHTIVIQQGAPLVVTGPAAAAR